MNEKEISIKQENLREQLRGLYSLKVGHSASGYVQNIRQYVGSIPLQLSGTGIIPYSMVTKKIMLQLRGDNKTWDMLGGGIDNLETYRDCAKKRIK